MNKLALLLAIMASHGSGVPALHRWEATTVATGYAAQHQRPGFRVEFLKRATRYRIRVRYSEPGSGPPETLGQRDYGTLTVIRRRYQMWVRESGLETRYL